MASYGKKLLFTHWEEPRSSRVYSTISEDNIQERRGNENEEETILKMCNKSALQPKEYRKMHNLPPQLSDNFKYGMPLRSYRKLFGKYGMAAEIDIKALWPSIEEMELENEREQHEFPHSVQQMIAIARQEKEENEMEIMARQNKIAENLKHLDKWMAEVRERKRKREAEALLSLGKKQQQVEEVRQIFGYNISPHDERFQEALEAKVEEDKKRMKKEKKLKREQQMLESLKEEAKQQALQFAESTADKSDDDDTPDESVKS